MTVHAIADDPRSPTTLYAATMSGFYKSIDDGLTWDLAQNGLPSASITGLVVNASNPDQILALTRDLGVFNSKDGAQSWSNWNEGMHAGDWVALAGDPNGSMPTTYSLFAASASAGVFKAGFDNWGWTACNSGLTNLQATDLWVDPSPNQKIFVTTHGGVFLSTDNAQSWSARNTGLSSLSTTTIRRIGTTLYLGTSDAGLFASSNDGASWSAIGAGALPTNIEAVAGDPGAPSVLYVGTSAGLFRSDDAGQTWIATRANGKDADVGSLLITSGKVFVGTQHRGVFRSFAQGR